MRARVSSAAVVAAAVASAAGAARAEPARPVAVHIVSRPIGASGPPDTRPERARADRGVHLYAVLEARRAGETVVFSRAPRVRLGDRTLTARPWREAPPAALLWYKVEPAVETLSNTASGRFRFESIPYRETLVAPWIARARVRADVRPVATTDRGDGVGTMRYKLAAVTATGLLSTPGERARRPRGGGLTGAVHRVSLRADDSYLGYLTELYGQPYIWASAGVTDADHQAERLEGADCADFAVYGWRRAGHPVPYTWTGGLGALTREIASGAPRDGVYRDAAGAPIRFPEAGDLVLLPRHVGVLADDRGVPGVLDPADTMLHTLFSSPREQALGDTRYAGAEVTILRWSGRD